MRTFSGYVSRVAHVEGKMPARAKAYTLREARERLAIDHKTLLRWLKHAGITPLQGDRDRRQRLLTEAQLTDLGTLFGRPPESPSGELDVRAALDALGRRVGALERIVERLAAIPAGEQWVDREQSDREPVPDRRGGRLPTILVVDDDPGIRKMLVEVLQLEGYPTETASNGREAMDMLARSGPRVVLLDLLMPVLTGRGVVNELSAMPEERARHRIILLSAWATLEEHADIEADGKLAKPFTVPQLLNMVTSIAA
jgi:two-component system, response regulator, stage 0 sporulation protein F